PAAGRRPRPPDVYLTSDGSSRSPRAASIQSSRESPSKSEFVASAPRATMIRVPTTCEPRHRRDRARPTLVPLSCHILRHRACHLPRVQHRRILRRGEHYGDRGPPSPDRTLQLTMSALDTCPTVVWWLRVRASAPREVP